LPPKNVTKNDEFPVLWVSMKQRNAAILMLCLAASVLRSRAQVFQVIDNLGGGQGSQPYAGLTVEGSVLFGFIREVCT
jgi:hypothetical protein